MLKKTGIYCALLYLLPALANAATYWQITASTSPAALKSNLTPARPANFGNYTTPNGGALTAVTRTPYPEVNFTAAVPIGYRLVNVKVDGIVKGTAAGTYTVAKGTTLSHTIVASYAAASYVISTYPATGGNISASVTAPAGSTQAVTITPFNGYHLTGAIIDNNTYAPGDALPSFVTRSGDASGATYTFAAVNAAHSVKGIFTLLPTATAVISTPGQSVTIGTSGIAIDGSASSSNVADAIYNWTASCGTVTPNGPNAKTATYTAPSTVGSCTVTLTVSAAGVVPGPQANVIFTVVSPVLVATTLCLECHDGTNGPAVPGFTGSPHYGVKSCADCHNPDSTLSHAYTPRTAMANICQNCHNEAQGNAPAHPFSIGVRSCVSCHNPHTAAASGTSTSMQGVHFSNVTTGMYPATYTASNATCSSCHVANTANTAILQQWARTGHAATTSPTWTEFDFKTQSDCVQCHTTTGFIAFSTARQTAAWGAAGDKTKEVLTCVACHSNVATGAVRTVAPVRPYSGDTYTNPQLGPSNVCAGCHSGRLNGNAIKATASAGADFGNLAFLSPHQLAATGVLFKTIGYEFAGKNYANSWHFQHDRLGINNYTVYSTNTGVDGPCIACHMAPTEKHTFSPVAKDGNGAVTAITNPMCNQCHTGALSYTADNINSKKLKYATALQALQKVLESKGIYYAESYPYFFRNAGDVSPGNAVTNWGTADTMGAAFNLHLHKHEPGGYIHNMVYTKRLLYDSIDYADNGALDLSVVDTINALAGLDAEQRANAVSFLIRNGVRY